ncbi:hypothetical protein B0H13DRAFT_1862600 [Mycena leptocephala]|nr:hypothetical protein B0H13DRAFT_1862600 [Mycena leptocephala]
MALISHQETHRLFGLSNCPEFNTNVCHRALLRKALELFSAQELEEIFGRPIKLRMAMGSAFTFSQLGKIKTNHARQPLSAYRHAYDTYFMPTGNDYAVRNAEAKSDLQAAEQTWHDWIVGYLAARGRPGRPAWALQPLPGLRRVHIAPITLIPMPQAETPARAPRPALFPPPTPLPSAPIPVGSRMHPITISDDKALRRPAKRRFEEVIDISDDEEQEQVSWNLSSTLINDGAIAKSALYGFVHEVLPDELHPFQHGLRRPALSLAFEPAQMAAHRRQHHYDVAV